MKQLDYFRNKVKTHKRNARKLSFKTKSESCHSARFIRAGLLGKINSSIALAFAMMLLLQSCSIYHKHPISREQASYSEAPLKLNMDGNNYRIEALKYNDTSTIAIAKRRAKISRHFSNNIIKANGKRVEIDLTEKSINSIRLNNKSSSTGGTIVSITLGTILIALAAMLSGSAGPGG